MGAGWTSHADAAAGTDRGFRPLAVAEADDALYQRLSAIMDAVRTLQRRVRRSGARPEWDRELEAIMDMLIDLAVEADHVELAGDVNR